MIDTTETEDFNAAIDKLFRTRTRAALVLGVPEGTLKKWVRGEIPVHPTASAMVDLLLTGWRPDDWHMTGPKMQKVRIDMGMTISEMGELLKLDDETVEKFEADFHGPPAFVARFIAWSYARHCAAKAQPPAS
jgi:DNA-binding transcriptional regulator YiaG